MKQLSFLFGLLCAFCLLAGTALAGKPFTVTGKTYCPLKYYINSPNKGDDGGQSAEEAMASAGIQPDAKKNVPGLSALMNQMDLRTIKLTNVLVSIGDEVKEEQVLATYEIPLENVIDEKRKLSQGDLTYYEYLLSQVNRTLDTLRIKRNEQKQMMQYSSISPQEIQQNLGDIDVQLKQRDYIEQILSEEKKHYTDQLAIAESTYGKGVAKMVFPKDGYIRSQLSGTVIWMNFDARVGKVFSKKTQLFLVGVLDPMVVRCAVHEIEAQNIKVGDPATIVFHTIPGKTFTSKISSVSFSAQPASAQQPSFYEVELILPNPDKSLKEGLRCDVTITPAS